MKLLKNEKGQALVEFTLVLPLILLILLGIMEFGILLNTNLSIHNAAREGARLGAVGGLDTEIEQLIVDKLSSLEGSNLNIDISPTDTTRKRGDSITIKVTYNYQVIMPIISNIINSSVELEAQTIMRVE